MVMHLLHQAGDAVTHDLVVMGLPSCQKWIRALVHRQGRFLHRLGQRRMGVAGAGDVFGVPPNSMATAASRDHGRRRPGR